MSAHDREVGRGVRARLFGVGADEALAKGAAAELAPQLNELSDEFVFGQVWVGDELPIEQRSLVTIAALVALGRERQLRAHIQGGLAVGLTRQQITGAIVQLAFYAGLPAAHTALEIAREVFAAADAGT